jgi:hypothetical protein
MGLHPVFPKIGSHRKLCQSTLKNLSDAPTGQLGQLLLKVATISRDSA